MKLYTEHSSNPKYNAQYNLEGRTHYVDDDTLKFHKSRIISTHIVDDGLLFVLIESYQVDYEGTSRAFRPVVFDVFGGVVERPILEAGYKTSKQACTAMWDILDRIDTIQITEDGISRQLKQKECEIQYLREDFAKLQSKNVAKG